MMLKGKKKEESGEGNKVKREREKELLAGREELRSKWRNLKRKEG